MRVVDDTAHEVWLLKLPVKLYARTQEHTAELIREMYLIEQQRLHDGSAAKSLPARLIELIEELTEGFSPMTAQQRAELSDAVKRDLDEIDLVYRLPVAAADASIRLNQLLDEADEFCRQGRHLLTLATPPELVRYRRWHVGEVATQLGGGPRTPWPEFAKQA